MSIIRGEWALSCLGEMEEVSGSLPHRNTMQPDSDFCFEGMKDIELVIKLQASYSIILLKVNLLSKTHYYNKTGV